MAKWRSGPGGGGGTPPAPVVPSFVQMTSGTAAPGGTTVSAILANPPTPGNQLLAVIGQYGNSSPPDTTGWDPLGQFCYYFYSSSTSSPGIYVLEHTVVPGDVETLTVNVNASAYMNMVVLIEVTPYGIPQSACVASDSGTGGIQSNSLTQKAACLGISGAIAVPILGQYISFLAGSSTPTGKWSNPAETVYSATYYGALTVNVSSATIPFGGADTLTAFSYTDVNALNPQNLVFLILLPA